MKNIEKSTFALFFGNRGFFPSSLQEGAREELPRLLHEWGYGTIMMEEKATRFGAVETPQEGQVYANFLEKNRGKFDGVILCLPNFGDETGAVAALKEADVPIFIHAYPDELDKMGPALRRDAFCGKFSVMDVFCQYGLPFTALKPHVVAPSSPRFKGNIDYFDRVCRVVKGMRSMVVGALGARTTAFKTVRIDELALQRHGITMETLDMSGIFARVKHLRTSTNAYKEKVATLKEYTSWSNVPDQALENIAKLGVVVDQIIEEYEMDAIAIRCWIEMEEQLGISPCVLLGELNGRGIAAGCEVDVGSAITMRALMLASEGPATCLDWNNNYEENDDKCILFHCGPVPNELMVEKGHIVDHAILMNAIGEGNAFGSNVGRIRPMYMTFGNLATAEGELNFYLGEGNITNDPIPADFFGCAGVAQIERLQDVLLHVGYEGHRHHVAMAEGWHVEPIREAFERYLGYNVSAPQKA